MSNFNVGDRVYWSAAKLKLTIVRIKPTWSDKRPELWCCKDNSKHEIPLFHYHIKPIITVSNLV